MLPLKKILTISCFIITLIVIGLMELDRNNSFIIPINEYYFKSFPLPILGIYNSIIRLAHPEHSHLFNSKMFKSDKILKSNFDNIQKEAIKVYNNKNILINFKELHEKIGKGIDEEPNKWKVFPIKFYGKINELALKLCPETCKTILKCEDIQIALFSILEPGKYIAPHKGPSTLFLRYQLGIKIPNDKDNCYIKVNNKKYTWNEGESIVFDDTYIHEVVNNTNEARIVLFVDIKRPVKYPFKKITEILEKNTSLIHFIKEVNDNIEKKYMNK